MRHRAIALTNELTGHGVDEPESDESQKRLMYGRTGSRFCSGECARLRIWS
jgi:hypothetical protein